MNEVFLVHGLWAPASFMLPLAVRLAGHGFRCRLFRYAGRSRSLEANAERLRRMLRTTRAAHFVGHSLGGLVILESLNAAPEIAAGHVVLLGTPACGSLSGRRFARHRIGRWLMGRSEPLWSERPAPRWQRDQPLGVIAGSMSLGLGRALGPLPGANDGVVRLDETTVEGMRDRIVLPVSHSAMMVSARAAMQTAEFLRHGRFRHGS